MAIFKPTIGRPLSSPKQAPRSLKNFKTCRYYSHESEATVVVDPPSDDSLQSPDRRRRYMRRGSRAPSMFLHSQLHSLRALLEQDDDSRSTPANTDRHRCERRPSIMSLLGEQLEQEAVVESRNQQSSSKAAATPVPPKLQRAINAPSNE